MEKYVFGLFSSHSFTPITAFHRHAFNQASNLVTLNLNGFHFHNLILLFVPRESGILQKRTSFVSANI